MRRDLLMVAVLQLAALGYGLWTVAVARPVHLVFEYGRFQVVHAIDVPVDLLPQAPPGLRSMPLWGPTPLSLRPFRDSNEKIQATIAALGGVALGARPDLWQDYHAAKPEVLKMARPVAELKRRFPTRTADIDAAVAATGRRAETLTTIPMIGRKSYWTVVLDSATAEVLAFIPLDSF